MFKVQVTIKGYADVYGLNPYLYQWALLPPRTMLIPWPGLPLRAVVVFEIHATRKSILLLMVCIAI